jgi:hypothetical protein
VERIKLRDSTDYDPMWNASTGAVCSADTASIDTIRLSPREIAMRRAELSSFVMFQSLAAVDVAVVVQCNIHVVE